MENRAGIAQILFPELRPEGILDTMDFYLSGADMILKLAWNEATAGAEEAQAADCKTAADRFIAIRGLLELYQAGVIALTDKLYEENRRLKTVNKRKAA